MFIVLVILLQGAVDVVDGNAETHIQPLETVLFPVLAEAVAEISVKHGSFLSD